MADREEPSFTQAERLNIRADEIATAHLEGRRGGSGEQPLEVVDGAIYIAATGGVWSLPGCSILDPTATITHDNPLAEMAPRAATKAFNQYWSTRAKRRVKEGTITEELRAATPFPEMDERVLRRTRGGTTLSAADWPKAVFSRSKLWWDNLPSQLSSTAECLRPSSRRSYPLVNSAGEWVRVARGTY